MLKSYFRILSNQYSFTSQSYYPTDLRKIYNFPSRYNGAGQKVAFIELGGGFVQSDLNNYFASLSLNSPTVQFVSVDGATNDPTDTSSPDVEVMLDLCIAIGVANGITPIVYMAPNSFQGFINAVAKAIADKVNVISISWGAPEAYWTSYRMFQMSSLFQTAASQGITVCVASGDAGSSDGIPGLNVDFPGSAPYALSCGGTRCSTANNVIISETVWNDAYGATGGGFSKNFAAPSYQPLSLIGKTKRGVPDVASNADPLTGIKVITDGQNLVVGGTSASAPFWAGVIAICNQALNKNVVSINSKLYNSLKLASSARPFRDIVSGGNGAYNAKTGWDACTGLGTPDVTKLVNYLLRNQ